MTELAWPIVALVAVILTYVWLRRWLHLNDAHRQRLQGNHELYEKAWGAISGVEGAVAQVQRQVADLQRNDTANSFRSLTGRKT